MEDWASAWDGGHLATGTVHLEAGFTAPDAAPANLFAARVLLRAVAHFELLLGGAALPTLLLANHRLATLSELFLELVAPGTVPLLRTSLGGSSERSFVRSLSGWSSARRSSTLLRHWFTTRCG